MAFSSHTARQSKQRRQRLLSTYRLTTFMHRAEHTSSHFRQPVQQSGSISICISALSLTAPRAQPIGQNLVQNSRPQKADQTAIRMKATKPAAMPVPAPTPKNIQVCSTASGRTVAAILRIMFHGSIIHGTATKPVSKQRIYTINTFVPNPEEDFQLQAFPLKKGSLRPARAKRSVRVPTGQTVEQYTRPNNKVIRSHTIVAPIVMVIAERIIWTRKEATAIGFTCGPMNR